MGPVSRRTVRVAIAALLLFAPPETGMAQGEETLASNRDQTASDPIIFGRAEPIDTAIGDSYPENVIWQPFTTGAVAGGYRLTEITVSAKRHGHTVSTLMYGTIVEMPRPHPRHRIADLGVPYLLGAPLNDLNAIDSVERTLTFHAPANTHLSANTTYYLYLRTTEKIEISSTTETALDTDSHFGWTIGRALEADGIWLGQSHNFFPTAENVGRSESIRMRVKGVPILPEVTVHALDPDTEFTEGDAVAFTLVRSGSTTDRLTVDIGLEATSTGENGIVTAEAISQTAATFAANEGTATVTVQTRNNETYSATPETVTISLTPVASATTATPRYAVGTPSTAEVRIADDDPAATVTGVAVTSTAPRYREVHGANVRDVYGAGDVIEFTVTFSDTVDVDTSNGVPTLTFSLGNADAVQTSAPYARGSGTDKLVFAHAVQAADSDSNGIFLLDDSNVTGGALQLNGGVLGAGINGVVSTAIATRGARPGHKVDGGRSGPYVESLAVTSTPQIMRAGETVADTYGAGEAIEFTLALSEAVTVTGTPHLQFSLGGTNTNAGYARGSGTDKLVFAYPVQSSDSDGDGIFVQDGEDVSGNSAVVAESGEEIDAVDDSADADLVNPGRGTRSGHRVDGSMSAFDAAAVLAIVRQDPTVSPTNADTLTWRVTFSEDVANVDPADFVLTGTTATLAVTEAAASTVFDVTASGGDLAALDGTVTLGFAPGQDITDTADTPNALADTAPTGTDERSYDLDNTAPTVTIEDVPGTSDGPFTATFAFSEAAYGFTVEDIAVGNGTASDFAGGDGERVFTARIAPAAAGEVTVDVAADAARDEAGNGNVAGEQAVSAHSPAPATVTGVAVTSTAPRYREVHGANVRDVYGAGDVIEFTVTFSDTVDVDTTSGVPTLTFGLGNADAGQTSAPYARGSGTDKLVFAHAVQAADSDSNGIFLLDDSNVTGGALQLNGGVLGAGTGGVVSTAIATRGARPGHKVDGGRSGPYVESLAVTSTPQIMRAGETVADTYGAGEAIEFTLALSEAVTVTGTPHLQFSLGGTNTNAGYARGSGTDKLVFAYPVQSSDSDGDGIFVQDGEDVSGNSAVVAESGEEIDAVDDSADADLVNPGRGTRSGHRVDGSMSAFDAVAVLAIVRQDPTVSPTNADTLTWRVTFSEDVANVDPADFVLTGTTAAPAVAEATASTVFDVTASGGDLAALDGTVTLGFAPGQDITDTADTPNALAATAPTGTDERSWVVDNTAPTVTIGDVPPTSDGPFTATFTFSEPVTGFAVEDITVGNGTASAFTDTDGGTTYTATITPAAEGAVTLDVAADVAEDAAANGNLAATRKTVDHDATAPTVLSVERHDPADSPTNADSLTWRVTFSEDVANVDQSDFEVTGSTATVTGVQAVSGETGVHDVTVSGGNLAGFSGTVTLGFGSGQDIADEAGNALAATAPTGADERSWVVDNTAPTVTIAAPAAANAPFTATFTFSEPVTGFTLADIAVGNGTASDLTGGDGDTAFTATITPSAEGAVTLDVAANAAEDAAGNGNVAAEQVSVTHDMTRPTVSIAAPDAANAPFAATFTFSEPVTGFTLADIAVGNGAASDLTGGDGGTTYTATITPSAEGAVTLDVAADAAEDAAGNGNVAAEQVSVTHDMTRPTVTITAPDAANAPFAATFTFSEPVTGFTLADIAVGNGTASDFTGGDGATAYTATITPSAEGAVTLDVAADAAEDAAGNGNVAAEQVSVTHDMTRPTVTITAPDAANAPFAATFTFSEPVTGFTLADIAVGNGAASDLTGGDGGTTYTATITPAAEGAVTLDVAADAAEDAAGNGNVAAEQVSVTHDMTRPTVTIAAPDAANAPFAATFTFSEPVTGFTLADIAVGNGAASDLTGGDGGTTYTATITPGAEGAVTLDVAADAAEDAAGNGNVAAEQVSVTHDMTRPTVTITAPDAAIAPFTATFTFSEPVTGFTLADIAVGNGAASDFTGGDGGTTYTATITPSAEGAVTLDVAADAVEDAAGNGNVAALRASTSADLTAPTVESVVRHDPAGSPTNADSLTWRVTFSEDVANVDQSDFAAAGTTATLAVAEATAATVFDVTASGGDLAELNGTVTLGFASGQDIADTAGIPVDHATPTGADERGWVVDNAAPTVSIAAPDAANAPFAATFTFSEPVTGFTLADIAVGNGAASAFADTDGGTTYTATITPGAEGVVTLDVAADAAEDAAGNGNVAAEQVSVTHDMTRPTVTITAPDAANAPFTATFTFSGPVTGFVVGDITVGNGTASGFAGGDGATAYTATITPAAEGEVTLDVAADVAADAAANGNLAATRRTVDYDLTAPTVLSVERHDPADSPTNADSLTWRVTFSEAVANVDAADFAVTGSTATVTGVQAVSGETGVHDVTVSGGNLAGFSGTVTLGFAAAQNIADEAGNALAATAPSGTDERSWVVDNAAPTVTIGDVPPTSDGPFTATFTFSEPVTGFAVEDITVGNGTASEFANTETGTTWTALITPSADGEVTVDVAADVAADEAGNGSLAAEQVSSAHAAPNTPPTARDGMVTTEEDTPYPFTAGDFNFADTDAGDTLASVTVTQLESAGDLEFDGADVTVGQVVPRADIDAGGLVFAPAANANGTGYATFMFRVGDGDDESASAYVMTVDVNAVNDAPAVANPIPDQSATAGAAFTFTVPDDAFEDVDGDTLEHSATQGDDTALPSWLTFTAATRTFQGTPGAGDTGTLTVKVKAEDGDGETASDQFDIVVSPPADATAPTVLSIVRHDPAGSPTNADSLTWRVTFSEDVANVDLSDFTAAGTTATLAVAEATASSVFDVTASGGDLAGLNGTVTLGFATAQDIADTSTPPNALADTAPTGADERGWVVDNAAPTVSIAAPDAANAPFTATFTFSEPVTGFTLADIAVGNGTASDLTGGDGGTTYTATITPSAEGEVTLDVAADAAEDEAGNGNVAAEQVSVTHDMTRPTVTITAPDAANALFTATFTFSGPVTGFALADIAVGNGTASAFADTDGGTTYTATITPSAEGEVTVDVAADAAADAASNGNLAATRRTVDYDVTAPTVTITEVPETSDGPFTATFTFSEPVTGFALGDIAVGNGMASAFADTDGGTTYTATITPSAEGEVTVDVAADAAEDEAGNGSAAATQAKSTYAEPNTAPTAQDSEGTTYEDVDYAPRPTEFNFTDDDGDSLHSVIVTALPAAGKGELKIGCLNDICRTLTASDLPFSVSESSLADGDFTYVPPGNANGDAFATFRFRVSDGTDESVAEYTMTIDITPVNDAPALESPIGNQSATVDESFSFTVPDDAFGDIDGDTLAYSATKGDDTALPSWLTFTAATRTFQGTPATAGTLTVKVTVEDGDGETASDAFDIVVSPPADTTAPRVLSIERHAPADSPTNADALTWRVTFSEDVANVDQSDFAAAGTTATLAVTEATAATVFDVTASGGDLAELNGTVTLGFATAQDIADTSTPPNALADTAPTGADERGWVVDNAAPTVSIAAPDAANAPFAATFTFSEPVTGFTLADIAVGNGAASAFADTDGGTTYTATITPSAEGAVTLDVAADAAEDAAGNGNVAAEQVSVTHDMTRPTVTITAPDAANAPFTATFTFSGPVTGFVVEDITVGNGTASAFTDTDGGTTYTATITPSAEGEVTLDVAADAAADAAANGNLAATRKTVDYDLTAPTVLSVERHDPAGSPTNADSLTWRVTFSEAVANVDAADFAVTGSTATVTGVQAVSGETGVHDVTVSGGNLAGFSGTVTLGFAAAQNIADEAGNALAATAPSGTDERSWVVDNTAPTVTIGDVPPTSDGPFTATFTFSEPVTGFAVEDITVGNGTASEFANTETGTTWTALITPSADGEVTVDVAADVAADEAGNGSLAAEQVSVTYAEPNAAPTARDGMVTTEEDTPYPFTAADFRFEDTDTGDVLDSVTVTQLESAGDLEFDGADVTVGQVVPRADIDAGGLVFAPAANANGTGYATFMFRVGDGDDESASAYVMTVDVNAVNDPATGAPAIAGTARVGETLTADASAIRDDADGLPALGAFAWQWLRAGDPDDAEIPGATGTTYTLAEADEGARFRVRVRFTDLDGHAEELVSEATLAVQASMSSNQPPTAVSGTVTLAEDETYAFKEADFGFDDEDAGDTLASVRIVTLPDAGALTLDGAAVAEDQEVPAAELAKLVYAPPADANADGRPYASFTFRVSDGTDESADTYTMAINVTPENDAPTVANGIADQAATTGTEFTFTVPDDAFEDIDGDTLQYSATLANDDPLPAWLTFNATNRTFTGTPATAGTLTVKVTVEDGDGETASDAFDIVVSPPRDATAPRVLSIVRHDPAASPTNADSLTWRVTFSEDVANVDVADFTAAGTTATLAVTEATASTVFDVTASGGNLAGLNGTVTLGFAAAQDIADTSTPPNALAGTAPTGADERSWELDNAGPALLSAAVEGTTVTLLYDEPLDAGSVPAAGDYSVSVDGTAAAPSAVALTGSQVALTLGAAPAGDVAVTVSYTVPATNPVRDRLGNEAGALSAQPVTRSLIRLAGGAGDHEGRVEVFRAGQWGTVCDDYWDNRDADVACRMAGHEAGSVEDAGRFRRAHFGEGSLSRIWLDNLRCTGGEESLFDCPRARGIAVGEHNCRPSENVGVRCLVTGGTAPPRVTGIELNAPPGDSWSAGETVEVTLAWSEDVTVATPAGGEPPKLWIGFSDTAHPHGSGVVRHAVYASGSGTARTVFRYTLKAGYRPSDLTGATGDAWRPGLAPDYESVEVYRNSLRLRGGTIVSASGVPAELGHRGHPEAMSQLEGPRVAAAPTISGAGPDGRWTPGETVEVGLPFDRQVLVTTTGGTPSVEIGFLDGRKRRAAYTFGSTTHELIFAYTLTGADGDQTAILVTPDSLAPGGGLIRGWPDLEPAALGHGGSARQAGPAHVAPAGPTASFSGVPDEHDGRSAFTLGFTMSEAPEPGFSFRTVRDHLFEVTGGRITLARRAPPGQDRAWTLTVFPGGTGAITVRMRETRSCDASPRVCTADGRPLAGEVVATVPGPARLSVADAQVREGAGPLEFAVTLSRARTEPSTVRYATADGTATAGEDYAGTSGTLAFEAGVTERTVSVPVLDDAHDEGTETLTLTLSDPAPAGHVRIADGTATGTIANTDPVPRAWTVRFGRTVAEQAVDAVRDRLGADRSPGFRGRLAGRPLPDGTGTAGEAADADAAEDDPLAVPALAEDGRRAFMALLALETGERRDAESGSGPESSAVSADDALLGTSFELVQETGDGLSLGLWGRVARSGFTGRDGDLSLDGEATAAMLGTDWPRRDALFGLMLFRSRGAGGYDAPEGGGRIEAELSGLVPWAGRRKDGTPTFWGAAGTGRGEMTLTPGGGDPVTAGLGWSMAAAGAEGAPVTADALGGAQVGWRADALWTRTASEAAAGLAAGSGTTSRLRLGLEATWTRALASGATLSPRLEAGLRHDGGDAETGFGLETGGGVRFEDSARGLSVALDGRALMLHEDGDFEDWGLAVTVGWDPRPETRLGPSVIATRGWGGASSGGVSALLDPATVPGPGGADGGARLDLEAAWGTDLSGWRHGMVGSAYGRVAGSPDIEDLRLGWRVGPDAGHDAGLDRDFWLEPGLGGSAVIGAGLNRSRERTGTRSSTGVSLAASDGGLEAGFDMAWEW